MRLIFTAFLLGLHSIFATLFCQNDPCAGTFQPGFPQISGNAQMTCETPYTTLTLQPGSGSSFTYSWAFDNAIISNTQAITVNRIGRYDVTVTASNGCTRTLFKLVVDACVSNEIAGLQPRECDLPDSPDFNPAESCFEACVTRCALPEVWGSTAPWQFDVPIPGWCSMIQNDQWFSFMALQESIEIEVEASNCSNGDGVQVAIYSSCQGPPLACEAGGDGEANFIQRISTSDLIPGQAYFIVIDGFSGDQCDFRMRATPWNSWTELCNDDCPPGFTCVGSLDTVQLEAPEELCPNQLGKLLINLPDNALITGYLWTAPPGTLINGQETPLIIYGPQGKKPSIQMGNESGNICVRLLRYFQPPSPSLCVYIDVNNGYDTTLPDTTVCAENLPYLAPWGAEIFSNGTYTGIVAAVDGCDSLLRQKVTIVPLKVNQFNFVVCGNECVSVGGQTYCESGFYSNTSPGSSGCEEQNNVFLTQLTPLAEIIAPAQPPCAQTSFVLNSATPSSLGATFKRWYRLPQNQLLGLGDQLTITQSGTYVLECRVVFGQVSCSAFDTITVDFTTGNLPLTTTAIMANPCISSLSILTASSISGTSFAWSGPDNFQANGASVTAIQAGTYTVIATAGNGCTSTASLVVPTVTPISVQAFNDTLNCYSPTLDLQATSNAVQPVYAWQELSPNAWQVTVTDAASGCTATDIAEILIDLDTPLVRVANLTINCSNPLQTLDYLTDADPHSWIWTGPDGSEYPNLNPMVGLAGDYTVVVTQIDNGCQASAVLNVSEDKLPPPLSIQQTPVQCGDTSYTLQAIAPGAVLIWWSGPDAWTDSLATTTVAQPGLYTAHAIGQNGCDTSAVVDVLPAPDFPQISVSGDSLTCADPIGQLSVTADSSVISFAWSGPNNFSSTLPNPQVDSIGVYTLIVSNTQGCSASAQAVVVGGCSVGATGIQLLSGIKVYPVPSTGQIYLESSSDWQNSSLQLALRDLQGKIIWSSSMENSPNKIPLDYSSIAAGTYLLSVQQAAKIAVFRIIIIP